MDFYLKGKFKKQNIFPGGTIKIYLNEWVSILDLIDLLNMESYYSSEDIKLYLDNIKEDAILEIQGVKCTHIDKVMDFVNTFKPKDNNAYMQRYIKLNKCIEDMITDNREIMVIFYGKVDTDKEWQLLVREFANSEQVALWIGTDKYYINKVLNGKLIHGQEWKPNIFYKNIENDKQIRYIVIYKDEWDSYSQKKKTNRINKLLDV